MWPSYAGVAIVDNQVAIFELQGGTERVRLVSLTGGSSLWEQTLESNYGGGIDADRGPRAVPSISQGKIIVYGASGQLSCLDLKNGKVLWSRAIRKEYSAEDGYFGAGSSPLIVGEKVIVAVGGKKNGGVVCVDLLSGKTLWTATSAEASYASPILLQAKGGSPSTVFVPTRLVAYGIDLQKGNVKFEFPFGQRGPTVQCSDTNSSERWKPFLDCKLRHWLLLGCNDWGLGTTYLQG